MAAVRLTADADTRDDGGREGHVDVYPAARRAYSGDAGG